MFLRPAVLALLIASPFAHARPFPLETDGRLATIVHADDPTIRLAGELLGRDLQRLSSREAKRATRLADCAERCIVVGAAESSLVKDTARALGIDLKPLSGQQERYIRAAGQANGKAILLIAGSDRRGAVYGVVDTSRELGISPWEWWADVAPRRPAALQVDGAYKLSAAPSVAWRGIFLNDEDWGLQPWAAKTYDPAKDIGPRTYARIFELMWRLKANLIWPAMHDSTKAFYKIPGNAQTAQDYAIVVGTSHAEPMMRNNVDEWPSAYGAFNWFTNRERMLGYWKQRVDEVKGFENMYTLGLRGKHDSAMEGATGIDHARATVEEVIGVQRALLADSLGKPATQIPQAFTMYKEVLDYYNRGLKVPADVTLVWPDDNYGYLHQLATARERRRSGGSGIYYHISYWGRPHDYLWLGTTHPALIRDQLQRAWAMQARRMWVVNVGDIKPLEYLSQYFLDAAFDARLLEQEPARHLHDWAGAQFGADHAADITAIQQEFYRLAWERRPEFMGWSQTEPTRQVRSTDYIRSGGEEAERRLARYRALTERAEALQQRLPADLHDAYFQLVLYPVRASALLNQRILQLDLATEYARQQRPSANLYAARAKEAHAGLVRDAAAYNALGQGKWAHMMDIAPRRLPVFAEPVYPSYSPSARRACGIVYPAPFSVEADCLVVAPGRPATRTVTLVSYGEQAVRWSVRPGASGVQVQESGGELNAANGYEQRITLRYDGAVKPALSLQCGERTVNLNLQTAAVPGERERILVLPAGVAQAQRDWEAQPGLGTSGQAVRARLDLRSRDTRSPGTPLEYRFRIGAEGGATLRFVTVPVHALTADNRLRLAVRLDDGPLEVLDYGTVGRSDEWKESVLSNMAVHERQLSKLAAGEHTVRVYALDPGIVLDRIDVVLDGAPRYYGMPPTD